MSKAAATRRFIIERTATLFNKRGFSGTHLSDIVKATGLTKGSIYGNFEDKKEVAIEAFKYNYYQLTRKVNLALDSTDNSIVKLLIFIRFYQDNYQQVFNNGGCAILNTSVESDDVDDDLHREVVKALLNWKNKIISIVENGIANNEISPINAEEFAVKMIALIEGSILLSKTLEDAKYLKFNLAFLEKEVQGIAL